jgi:hypothetical protein
MRQRRAVAVPGYGLQIAIQWGRNISTPASNRDLIIAGDELKGPGVAVIFAFRDRRNINSFL